MFDLVVVLLLTLIVSVSRTYYRGLMIDKLNRQLRIKEAIVEKQKVQLQKAQLTKTPVR